MTTHKHGAAQDRTGCDSATGAPSGASAKPTPHEFDELLRRYFEAKKVWREADLQMATAYRGLSDLYDRLGFKGTDEKVIERIMRERLETLLCPQTNGYASNK